MTVIPMQRGSLRVGTIELPRTGRPIVGPIATLNPTTALLRTVGSLLQREVHCVIVIDDGSYDPESLDALATLETQDRVHVIHQSENGGKSAALRAGYLALPNDPRIVIIQTDDDTLAGDLQKPFKMIRRGRADIVDIRVETYPGKNLIGLIQQLDYWLINMFIK